MGESESGDEVFGLNRAQRRKKFKNRQFTKKGFTRVIRRDEEGNLFNIPTRKDSRIHNLAKHSVHKMHRDKDVPYKSKRGTGR